MKIRNLHLSNFKNYSTSTLQANSKNILLYGGNGAGKSSLAKALNLFFQGRKITANYFQGNTNPVLTYRRIDNNGTYSSNTTISMDLDDNTNIILNSDTYYTDKNLFCQSSEMKRDYSYKDVVEIFNTTSKAPFHDYLIQNFGEALKVKISDIEAVTSVSYETILSYIQGHSKFAKHKYVRDKNTNDEDVQTLQKFRQKSFFNDYANDDNSKKGLITIKKLVDLIDLKESSDNIIDKKLKTIIKKIKQYLIHEYSKYFADEFAKYISLMPVSKEIKLAVEASTYYDFELFLTIDYNGVRLKNPNGYLNEAKISEMGISIICSLIKIAEKYNEIDFSPIIFDDLLVSLDMTNRQKLITIIMEYFDNNQIFFFTHDMSLFELMIDELKAEGKDEEWKYCILNNNNIEDYQNYLQTAKTYLSTHNKLKEAAIFLRLHLEYLLKDFLRKHDFITDNLETAGPLINKTKRYIEVLLYLKKEENRLKLQNHIETIKTITPTIPTTFCTSFSKAFDFDEKSVKKFLITDLDFVKYDLTGDSLEKALVLIKKVDNARKHIFNLGPHDTTTDIFSIELKNAMILIDDLKKELDLLNCYRNTMENVLNSKIKIA